MERHLFYTWTNRSLGTCCDSANRIKKLDYLSLALNTLHSTFVRVLRVRVSFCAYVFYVCVRLCFSCSSLRPQFDTVWADKRIFKSDLFIV